MKINKLGLFDRYAECEIVSNIAFSRWSKAVTLTPMMIPWLLRIFLDKNNIKLAINPKIPPSEKYNQTGCGVLEH